MAIVVIGLVCCFAGLVIFVGVKIMNQGRDDRRRAVETVLASRGGDVSQIVFVGEVYSATSHGHEVDCRFVTRGSGDSEEHWIVAEVQVAIASFEMELRPKTIVSRLALSTGRAIDVDLGDDEFERAYIVEAAPAEVARTILDAPTRAWLLRVAPAIVRTSAIGLVFERRGRVEDATDIRSTFEALGRLATRVAPAERAARDVALDSKATGGYRQPAVPISPTAVPEHHATERATLHEVRRRRARVRTVFLALSLPAFAAVLLAMSFSKC